MKLCLQIIVNEKGEIRNLELGQSTSIGRSFQNRIQIEESYVSSRHAIISQSETGLYTIEDCGSKNGTYVNNQSVSGVPVQLSPGDVIRFGLAACTVVESGLVNEFKPTTAQICPAGQRTETCPNSNQTTWPTFTERDYQPGFKTAFRPVKKKATKKKVKPGKVYLKGTQTGAKRFSRFKIYDPFISQN